MQWPLSKPLLLLGPVATWMLFYLLFSLDFGPPLATSLDVAAPPRLSIRPTARPIAFGSLPGAPDKLPHVPPRQYNHGSLGTPMTDLRERYEGGGRMRRMCDQFKDAFMDDASPRFQPANTPRVFDRFFKAPKPACPDDGRCSGNQPCAEQHLNRTYQSCSLVGSSWILAGSQQGAAIDSSEVVIRINNHNVKGREADLGTRTDIRLINNELCTRFLDDPGVEKNVVIGVLELCWRFKPTPQLCPRIPHLMFITEKWMNLPSDFLDRTARIIDPQGKWKVRGKWPSNGIRALLVVMRQCQQVRLFGLANVFDDYIRAYDSAAGNKTAESVRMYSFSGTLRQQVEGMPHNMLAEAHFAHTLERCFPDRVRLMI
mmetsp:Transcript_8673/g.27308  ORF Transcript_8673/g.27308 Transcript_8673/m.27308 type:complete len:372 (+) Transcript_8673:1-1116(+)